MAGTASALDDFQDRLEALIESKCPDFVFLNMGYPKSSGWFGELNAFCIGLNPTGDGLDVADRTDRTSLWKPSILERA